MCCCSGPQASSHPTPAPISSASHEPAREVGPDEVAGALADSGAIVDAIFGTGFSGAPRSPAADAIEAINRSGAPAVAADVASGVDAATGEVEGPAVEAAVTVAFHAAKLGHRIAPGKRHAGELRVADIGIPGRAIPSSPRAGRSARASCSCPRSAGRIRRSSRPARCSWPAAPEA